jgi:hypothetical protein
VTSRRDQRPCNERISVSSAASPSADTRHSSGAGPRSVHDSRTVTRPSSALSPTSTTAPARRLANKTSSRRPLSGWNGCVIRTEPEGSLEATALCRLRCDTERTLAPAGFRDVRPARGSRPVAPCVQPAVQVLEITLQVLAVCRPCNAVHSWCSLRAQRPVSRPQTWDIDMVQESGEPRISVPSCYFPHTVQPVRHALPGSGSGTCCAVRVPLGWAPFLHRLRRRLHGLVRQLRRYYAPIRLPTLVHLRLAALAFPERPAR